MQAKQVMESEVYTPQMGDMHIKETAKLLNIIFVVDVSLSMKNEGKIDVINEIIYKVVSELKQLYSDIPEFEIHVAIMSFAENPEWVVLPTSIMDYMHKKIICRDGIANFGKALKELGEKLSRNEFMAHIGGIARPVIMLMTDDFSFFAPEDDYQIEIDKLLKNGWFNHSLRYLIQIGNGSNAGTISEEMKKFVNFQENAVVVNLSIETLTDKVKNILLEGMQPKSLSDKGVSKREKIEENVEFEGGDWDIDDWNNSFI